MRDLSIYGIVFVIMLCVLILQVNVFDGIRLVGTAANLGVVLVSAVGLMTGKARGAGVGAVYGMMVDFIEGRSLGGYLVAFLLLGYFCGRMGHDFSKDNRTTAVAMTGIGTIFLEGMVIVFKIVLLDVELELIYFGMELAKEALYNMLIAIVAFPFLYRLSDLLNRTKNNYYML